MGFDMNSLMGIVAKAQVNAQKNDAIIREEKNRTALLQQKQEMDRLREQRKADEQNLTFSASLFNPFVSKNSPPQVLALATSLAKHQFDIYKTTNDWRKAQSETMDHLEKLADNDPVARNLYERINDSNRTINIGGIEYSKQEIAKNPHLQEQLTTQNTIKNYRTYEAKVPPEYLDQYHLYLDTNNVRGLENLFNKINNANYATRINEEKTFEKNEYETEANQTTMNILNKIMPSLTDEQKKAIERNIDNNDLDNALKSAEKFVQTNKQLKTFEDLKRRKQNGDVTQNEIEKYYLSGKITKEMFNMLNKVKVLNPNEDFVKKINSYVAPDFLVKITNSQNPQLIAKAVYLAYKEFKADPNNEMSEFNINEVGDPIVKEKMVEVTNNDVKRLLSTDWQRKLRKKGNIHIKQADIYAKVFVNLLMERYEPKKIKNALKYAYNNKMLVGTDEQSKESLLEHLKYVLWGIKPKQQPKQQPTKGSLEVYSGDDKLYNDSTGGENFRPTANK